MKFEFNWTKEQCKVFKIKPMWMRKSVSWKREPIAKNCSNNSHNSNRCFCLLIGKIVSSFQMSYRNGCFCFVFNLVEFKISPVTVKSPITPRRTHSLQKSFYFGFQLSYSVNRYKDVKENTNYSNKTDYSYLKRSNYYILCYIEISQTPNYLLRLTKE